MYALQLWQRPWTQHSRASPILWWSVFIFFPLFKIGLFAFLLLSLESSLYILDMSHFPGIWYANIFLPLYHLHSHSLNIVLQRAAVLNFWWSTVYPFCLVWVILLELCLRNLCLTHVHGFSSINFILLGFAFNLWSILNMFLYILWSGDWNSFSWILITNYSSTICWKDFTPLLKIICLYMS